MSRPKIQRGLTEADIQRTCTDYLELDGWRALRTDPCSDRGRAKGFGELGMADHLYIRYLNGFDIWIGGEMFSVNAPNAQILWIEYKRPGCLPTEKQRAWHAAERARGALTVMAGVDFEASIDGFLAWYRSSGLNRGKV